MLKISVYLCPSVVFFSVSNLYRFILVNLYSRKVVSMAFSVKKLGISLSLDHHDQLLLVYLFLLFSGFQAWWSLIGLILYCFMHFSYGGSGTFQRPPRMNEKPGNIWDIIIVFSGITGIILMAGGLLHHVLSFAGKLHLLFPGQG